MGRGLFQPVELVGQPEEGIPDAPDLEIEKTVELLPKPKVHFSKQVEVGFGRIVVVIRVADLPVRGEPGPDHLPEMPAVVLVPGAAQGQFQKASGALVPQAERCAVEVIVQPPAADQVAGLNRRIADGYGCQPVIRQVFLRLVFFVEP